MNSYTFGKHPVDRAVINLDNYGRGTHWVSMKRIPGKSNLNVWKYHDSFGVEPDIQFQNRKHNLTIYNPYVEQSRDEVNCGARSINSLLR